MSDLVEPETFAANGNGRLELLMTVVRLTARPAGRFARFLSLSGGKHDFVSASPAVYFWM